MKGYTLPTKVLYRENTLTVEGLLSSLTIDEVNSFGYVYFNDSGKYFKWFAENGPLSEEIDANNIGEIIFIKSEYEN